MDRSMNIFLILMYIGLILFSIFNIVQGEENVALKRNTRQSSTYKDQHSSGLSSLAVDGNTDNVFNNGSCSHTNDIGTNWWCVDLGENIDFQNIKIYNRNTNSKRLQGFELRLSSTSGCNNNGYNQSTVCYKDNSTTTQDIYNIDSCNQTQLKFNSRYVYISVENPPNQGNGDKYLTLCEVEIFEKCESNCKDGCDSNGICNNCTPGYYGNKCKNKCSKHCKSGCQRNGACICSEYCKNGCRRSDGICNGCKPGYRGNYCNTKCDRICYECHQTGTYCTKCYHKYWGYSCKESCGGNCNNGCQNNGNCIGGCKNGFWGLRCNDNCNKCNQGCQQDNGDCNDGGCETGYYGDKCYKQCPTNCNGDCQQSNGYCTECKNYYWGDKCEEQCSPNCRYHTYTTCYQIGGKCDSGCKTGWYGDTCNKKCSSNCFNECDQATGRCTSCKDTWYGDTCNNTCNSNCINRCDQDTGRCTSCKTGWYGNQCLAKCNGNCNNGCNHSTGRCTSCKDGYYGKECTKQCPISCSGNCHRDSGHCKSCKSGIFGDYCNESCSIGCLPGKDQSSCNKDGRCTVGCINGRYGNNCNGECSTGCKNGTCKGNDGFCISGCVSGKSGRNCTKDCNKNCTICNQYDNKNCYQCHDGYYGQSCEQPCSKTCQSQNNNPVCNKTNGYCTSGCVAGKIGNECSEDCSEGYYGLRCNSTCGNCYNQTICHIVSGACGLVGCQSGFQGPTCKEVIEKTDHNSIPAVIVSLVVVIGVVIGVIFIIRRKKWRKCPPNKLRSSRRSDIILSTTNPSHVNKGDALQYNTLPDNSSADNVPLDIEDDVDNQAIYQNIGGASPTSSTMVNLRDLWNYSQQRLNQLTEQYQKLPKGLCRPHEISLNEINGPKNRYKNICAFDDTRVKLEPIDNDPNSDYINACYISMYGSSSKYIASQGPIKVNMEEFIRMIWDVDASKIVMLTNLVEHAIEKCKQYWPDLGKTQQFGQINMKLIKEEVYAHFTIRELQITKGKSSPRILRQYHYTSWPDKDVPSDIASLVEFHNKVFKSSSRRQGPMIVHCSAGIGRTGTFLALDYLIQQAQVENSVDIYSCVSQMRQERINMVQTVTQYIFLHDALTVWYLVGDTTTVVTNYPQIYNQLLKQDKQTNMSQLQHKYQLMNKISCKIDKEGYSEALKSENKNKNRDQHVLAANSTRVLLMRTAYENSSDYINAVYLSSYKKKRGYIVTQTPLPNTVEDFWLMVLQSETKVVISLEDNKAKNVGDYLPKTEIKFGEMTIKLVKEDINNTGYYDAICYKISQETNNINRTVRVYQCHFWKGQNKIPESCMSIFTLLEEISSITDSGPLIVSCLNGANKSGLLCVLAAIIERLTIEQDVSIIQTILQLRISRPEIINSFEQFKFCFDAVGVYLDQFSDYVNSC